MATHESKPWTIQYEEEAFNDQGVSSGWSPKFHTIWSDTESNALQQFQIDVPPVDEFNRKVSKVFLNKDWVRQFGGGDQATSAQTTSEFVSPFAEKAAYPTSEAGITKEYVGQPNPYQFQAMNRLESFTPEGLPDRAGGGSFQGLKAFTDAPAPTGRAYIDPVTGMQMQPQLTPADILRMMMQAGPDTTMAEFKKILESPNFASPYETLKRPAEAPPSTPGTTGYGGDEDTRTVMAGGEGPSLDFFGKVPDAPPVEPGATPTPTPGYPLWGPSTSTTTPTVIPTATPTPTPTVPGTGERVPFKAKNVDDIRDLIMFELTVNPGLGNHFEMSDDKTRALESVGITYEDLRSNDYATLEKIRGILINTNILSDPAFGYPDRGFHDPKGYLGIEKVLRGLDIVGVDDERRGLEAGERLRGWGDERDPGTGDIKVTEDAKKDAFVGVVTPQEYNQALQAIRAAQQGDMSAVLPESIIQAGLAATKEDNPAAVLLREFTNAQGRTMPFGAETQKRTEQMEQFTEVDLPLAQLEAKMEEAGLAEKGENYRAQLQAATMETQRQTQEMMQNTQVRSDEMISLAGNQSREYVSEVSANASRDVARINGLTSQQVALINTRSAAEVAEITGMNQREVERIKGEIQERIAAATNMTSREIARLQTDAQMSIADTQKQSAESVTRLNNAASILIATESTSTQSEIAKLQYETQVKIATENNTTQKTIANLIYSNDAEALRTKEFETLKDIEKIRHDYAKELSQAIDISPEALEIDEKGVIKNMEQYIAEMNNKAAVDLQKAQLKFEETKYAAELEARGEISDVQMEMLEMQFLEGYTTPQLYQAALLERERGGLTKENFTNLQKILAAGGLSTAERLTQIKAESRSAEMNSLLALLSNPQALGAFVTMVSGGTALPFETVPTMGQLIEMAPARVEYLQGALSALGIDPQTFIRMAQEITPQAFQEGGPFGQLSAMVA